MQAKDSFNALMTTEPSARCVEHYPNELLEQAMKVCVSNSLVPLRCLMMKGKCRVEISSKGTFATPLLDVVPLSK